MFIAKACMSLRSLAGWREGNIFFSFPYIFSMKDCNFASRADHPNANKYYHITLSRGKGHPPTCSALPSFSNPKGPRLDFYFPISNPTAASPIPPPSVESMNLLSCLPSSLDLPIPVPIRSSSHPHWHL